MSGELKIQTGDGAIYWFGRDDHYPNEVRVYGQDTRHWSYMTTDEARSIVKQGLSDGEIQQGDAVRFFDPDGETTAGDD